MECVTGCLNYTETWLGISLHQKDGGPEIVGDSSSDEMNKNMIGLSTPASWRKAGEGSLGVLFFSFLGF